MVWGVALARSFAFLGLSVGLGGLANAKHSRTHLKNQSFVSNCVALKRWHIWAIFFKWSYKFTNSI